MINVANFSDISIESGIPDYRSEGVGLYATSSKRPVQHKVFMDNPKARQSYWARNFIGWPRWSSFQPNSAHPSLANWERSGRVGSLVTQNVDQLHYKAGSRSVIEPHGTSSVVQHPQDHIPEEAGATQPFLQSEWRRSILQVIIILFN